MHEMTIVDLVAFFSILPAHKEFFDGEEARRLCPKISRWAERLLDNEDLLERLQSMNLDPALLTAAQDGLMAPRPKL